MSVGRVVAIAAAPVVLLGGAVATLNAFGRAGSAPRVGTGRDEDQAAQEHARVLGAVASSSTDTDGLAPSVQLDHGTTRAAVQRMEREIDWVDDGRCYTRAMRGAAMLYESEAASSGGSRDARSGAAAIAVLSGPFDEEDWQFHAAVSFRDESGAVQVYDGLAGTEPMSLERWATGLGREVGDVRFVAPWEAVEFQRVGSDAAARQTVELDRPWATDWYETYL